ncbi:MAG: ribosome assembly cofactor RimP [Paraprevotella sp.]|nr:ribosome assembly cofactor RimP [Paraprevotella sp.]
MISKSAVEQAVNEWLEGKEYFLVEICVSADDKIEVLIDHADGVWIEDCADLSRFIESKINREDEDYELEVGSAGLGYPFKVRRQWEIHIGKPVETQLNDGHKYRGILTNIDEETFTVTCEEKVKHEGAKRPKMEQVPHTFRYEEASYTKYWIK